MMEFDSKFSRSVFSGLYKVVKVVSTFQNGLFKQVLEMVRLVRQTDYEGGKKKETVERTGDAGQASDALTLKNNTNTEEVAGATGTPDNPNSDPGDAQKSAQDQQATENKTTEGDTPAVTDEQKKLMEKAPDMETKPVDTASQPPAVPSPQPPSEAKLALKEKMKALDPQREAWAEATNLIYRKEDSLAAKKRLLAQIENDPNADIAIKQQLTNNIQTLDAEFVQARATIAANEAAAKEYDVYLNQYNAAK
jgi:hypothetical protein